MNKFTFLFVLVFVNLIGNAQEQPEWFGEMSQMVKYFEEQPQNFGLAIGIIDNGKVHQYYAGELSPENPNAPDSTTVFELGGLAKVFTAQTILALADSGKIELDSSISSYINFPFENRFLGNITIQQLLTHTSGLPKKPFNLKFYKEGNEQPWANYPKEALYDFLATYKPKADITAGETFQYSDIGYALLGILIQQFKTEKVTAPEANILGHNVKGEQVPNWQYPNYLQHSINQNDNLPSLINHIQHLLQTDNPLNSQLLKTQAATSRKKVKIAYAWHLVKARRMGWNVYTHAGSSGGFRSFIAFNPKENSAVILLSNTNTKLIDNLGINLLDLIVD